jgi:thiol-disulfide isomerase/thioredoxin
MRLVLIAASLYTAALAGATPAQAWDAPAIEAARAGEMTRLAVHPEPKPPVEATFLDAEGVELGFDDWAGAVTLVNFWATWCPPCLKEMPSLDRLAAALEGEDFALVAISTDRGDGTAPRRWLAENGIERLAFFHDPRSVAARAVGLVGQPTTLILDREGREVARFQGDAEWDSPEALALLRAVIAETADD